MHFPDSVLSPSTSLITGAAMLPVWAMAGKRVQQTLGTRQVPLLALGAAFCFTVMMFNLPALGGTTAHPVAGTLIAVLLGPWAAVIGVSVALAIQALFFGDGGILSYGANCFSMAFALPFVGYSVYRLLAGRLPERSPLRAVFAGVGAYIGINAAAAIVAVLLGIQPALFHESNGHALYFPFGLKVTLPVMLGTHLLIAGPAEAVVTAMVALYALRARLPLYGLAAAEETASQVRQPRYEPLWVGLLALLALSPLGLLAQGEAWGEWDKEGVTRQIEQTTGEGYTPKGLAAAEEHSHRGLHGWEDYGSEGGGKKYMLAGLMGAGTIASTLLLTGPWLTGKKGRRPEARSRRGASPSLSSPAFRQVGKAEEEGKQGESAVALLSEACEKSGKESDGAASHEDALPAWLCQPYEEIASAGGETDRPANPFVERTLAELTSGAAATLQSEQYARQAGYLQSRDPHAKLLAFLALIGVVTCIHNPLTLLALYGVTLALGQASRLPIGMMMRRVWLSVPLFVGAVILPSALNVVTPGRALWIVWNQPYLAVTDAGLLAAFTLTLRVGVAVSLAMLLTLTTGWNDLLGAMQTMRVPRFFLNVLTMTYRYLIVLMQTAAEMFLARRSRTVGYSSNGEGRRFVGNAIGALFGKTLTLSEEVHAAMLSRGFQGRIHTLHASRWKPADSLWTAAMLLLAVIALGGEYVRF